MAQGNTPVGCTENARCNRQRAVHWGSTSNGLGLCTMLCVAHLITCARPSKPTSKREPVAPVAACKCADVAFEQRDDTPSRDEVLHLMLGVEPIMASCADEPGVLKV
jgi:hypothetical protein